MKHPHPTTTSTVLAALAVLGFVIGLAFRADGASPASAALLDATPVPPPPAQEMVLLHTRADTRILGFNAQGRLLTYDEARRVFQARDLAATNGPVSRWSNPDGGQVAAGALSSDGRTLAALSETGKDQSRIRFWNGASGAPLDPSITWTNVGPLAFSPDGRTLAGLNGEDGSIQLWEVATGEARAFLALPQRIEVGVFGIRFSPDGRHLATESGFRSLHVWNATAGRFVGASFLDSMYNTISPDWKWALRVAFGPAGRSPRTELLDFSAPEKPVLAPKPISDEIASALNAAAFSPDGRLVSVNMRDETLRLWDIELGRAVDRPQMRVGRLIRLALSPDNRLVATHEPDRSRRGVFSGGSLRIWDVATGQPCGMPQPISGMLRDWWFDPGARHLVVSISQGSGFGAQIWSLPSGATPSARSEESQSGKQPRKP